VPLLRSAQPALNSQAAGTFHAPIKQVKVYGQSSLWPCRGRSERSAIYNQPNTSACRDSGVVARRQVACSVIVPRREM
jgi:hypothetical protein